jgi:hypothetical protein
MREYGMGYFDVLRLPLKTFWSLNRQVDRLRAEGEQRQLRVIGAAQDPKTAKQLGEALDTEIGTPVVVEKAFDSKQFEELSKRFGQIA